MSIEVDKKVKDPTLSVQLVRRIQGIVQTQLIFVAAHFGLADLLKNGPKSIAELAILTETVELRLYRTMRALASFGIFEELTPRHFGITPLAIPLQRDAEDSVRDLALMVGSGWHVRSWSNILHSLHKEESAFEGVFGSDIFDYLANDKCAADAFDNAMSFTSKRQARAIVGAYDFSRARTIIDIGGGQGFLLFEILKSFPSISGILFERAEVAEKAKTLIQSADLNNRCEIVSGDFFFDIPDGGDLYVMKYVLHDWDDSDAVKILKNVRRVISPHGRLLVIETVLSPSRLTFEQVISDAELMVMLHNGRERSEDEFAELFHRSGFKLNSTYPTRCELSILEVTLN